MARLSTLTQNQKAFLDMIAYSEIGPRLLAASDDGYNVIVGGGLFNDYSTHPNKRIFISRYGIFSSAAGRYQLLKRYYDAYSKMLGLNDFSPESQDAIALQQIKERGALGYISAGDIEMAIYRCKNIWASLPGAGYGQNENKITSLKEASAEAGGRFA